MDFPWSDIYTTPDAVDAVISLLQRLTLHNQRRKEILLDWCKDVDYPYNHDLFLWLWQEIDESVYRQRHPDAP